VRESRRGLVYQEVPRRVLARLLVGLVRQVVRGTQLGRRCREQVHDRAVQHLALVDHEVGLVSVRVQVSLLLQHVHIHRLDMLLCKFEFHAGHEVAKLVLAQLAIIVSVDLGEQLIEIG
jgi:hypothetical protein